MPRLGPRRHLTFLHSLIDSFRGLEGVSVGELVAEFCHVEQRFGFLVMTVNARRFNEGRQIRLERLGGRIAGHQATGRDQED